MNRTRPCSRREILARAARVAALAPLAGLASAAASGAPAAPAPGAGGAAEGGSLLGPATAPSTNPGADPWRGLKVGVATYSFRKFPLDAVIKGTERVGLKYLSIKDFHLPLKSTRDERRAVAQKLQDAGLIALSCGVITMPNDEAKVREAFEYARDLGVPTIVCSPEVEALPLLDKMVKEFDLRAAIHNHGPEDKKFPSPYDVWKAVERYDPRVGLCIDVGHSARAKADPAEAIVKCRQRLYDVHFKDVIRLDRGPGAEVEVGRGVLDIKAMLQALLEVRFAGHVGFEHERNPEDPLPGLAESVGYTKATLAPLASL